MEVRHTTYHNTNALRCLVYSSYEPYIYMHERTGRGSGGPANPTRQQTSGYGNEIEYYL
jgi:hypothetical protein